MSRVVGSSMFVACMVIGGAALAAGNRSNDYLLSLAKPAQADMLGKVVAHDCKGVEPFYKGIAGPGQDLGYWDVRCTNGKSYEIELHPDGSSQVRDCSTLELRAVQCFQRLSK